MRKVIYAFLMLLSACTNIDCPLDNVVVMTSGLYRSEDGSKLTLKGTRLSVLSADGSQVLLNAESDMASFAIPLRHNVPADTLLFLFENNDEQHAVDSLILSYTDSPHFESVDCPAALYHTLHDVQWTSHALGELPLTIEKVKIVRPLVDYDDVENLKIYLRSTVE